MNKLQSLLSWMVLLTGCLALVGCPSGMVPDVAVGGCLSNSDCPGAQICNPCSLRCIADPGTPDEGAFVAEFDFRTDRTTSTIEQNVLGRVRWDDEETTLCTVFVSEIEQGLEFRLARLSDDEILEGLEISASVDPATLPVDEDIAFGERFMRVERDRGIFGEWSTSDLSDAAARSRDQTLEIHAVINSGRLRLDEYSPADGVVRGRANGRLRAAGPYERRASCYDDNGLFTQAVVADPRNAGVDCVERFDGQSILGSFTCRYVEAVSALQPRDGIADVSFRVDADEGLSQDMFCSAAPTENGRISIVTTGPRNTDPEDLSSWGLALELPGDRVAPGQTLVFGGAGNDVEGSIFDILPGVGLGELVPISGQIGIELTRLNPDRGYISFWLSAGDGSPLSTVPAPAGGAVGGLCTAQSQCDGDLTCQPTLLSEAPDWTPRSQCIATCASGCSENETCFVYEVDGASYDLCASDVVSLFSTGCDPASLSVCFGGGVCAPQGPGEPSICLPRCENSSHCEANQICVPVAEEPGAPSVCVAEVSDFALCTASASACGPGASCTPPVPDADPICLPECTSDPCAADQVCATDGFCRRSIPRGDPCGVPEFEAGSACGIEDICLSVNGAQARCRQTCDLGPVPPNVERCPTGLVCVDIGGGDGACIPE